jgi:PhnB protein
MPVFTIAFTAEGYVKNGTPDCSFYTRAWCAIVLRRCSNDDGSLHVAELSIEGTILHLHEASASNKTPDPGSVDGTTVAVGLFVDDVDWYMNAALAAGATEISPLRTMITATGRELSKTVLDTCGCSKKRFYHRLDLMQQLCRCSPPDLLSPEYARFSQRGQASHFAQDQTN